MPQYSSATVQLTGLSPYSQSRQHMEPKKNREAEADYDRRTWRSKMTIVEVEGKPSVAIPAAALHQCLWSGARYSGKKIRGAQTWTQKFMSGIAISSDAPLGVDPESVKHIALSCHVNGMRGSAKRVVRWYPHIPRWQAKFEVMILDQIITQPVFEEIFEMSGIFIGLGRGRPENAGQNGRFAVKILDWVDGRDLVPVE